MSKEFKGTRKTVAKTPKIGEPTSEKPRLRLSQIKPKFFRRSVLFPYVLTKGLNDDFWESEIMEGGLAVLSHLRTKRYYLRKLHEQQYFGLTDKFYLKLPKQTVKYATHMQIQNNAHKITINVLKTARCLRKIQLEPGHFHSPCFFQLLKSTEKHISKIYLSGTLQLEQKDVHQLYRTLGSFYRLSTLQSNIRFAKKGQPWWRVTLLEDYFSFETDIIQRYLARLPCLQELRALHWNSSQHLGESLKERESQQLSLVTSLSVRLLRDMLPKNLDLTDISKCEIVTRNDPVTKLLFKYDEPKPQVQALSNFINEKDKDFKDENKNHSDRPQMDASALEDFRQKLIQKFDFGLFPNLRDLRLCINEEKYLGNTSFVVGGFETLKNLEMMNVKVNVRPYGFRFFFHEIQNLPLLTHFSLKVPFIQDEEWNLFAQFISKQNNLISLYLEVTESDILNIPKYREFSIGLGNVLKALENTPKLEHLKLRFFDCPFTKFAQECLSQGFEHASKIVSQLKSLSFTGVFLPIGYGTPNWNHLEGFKKFIQQQKSTLTTLKVTLDFLIDAGAALYLSSVIPDLQELRVLKFNTNTFGFRQTLLSAYIDFILSTSYIKKNLEETIKMRDKSWSLLITQFPIILSKLLKIEELDFELERSDLTPELGFYMRTAITETGYDEAWNNLYFKVVEILPALKTLRKLRIGLPEKLFEESYKEQTFGILIGLKEIDKIEVDMFDWEKYRECGGVIFPAGYMEVAKTVEAENARKFAKSLFQEDKKWVW